MSNVGILKQRTLHESLSSSSLCPSNRSPSSVSFDSIEIYEHPIILGDGHTFMTGDGPALTIAWEAASKQKTSLTEYESSRRRSNRGESARLLEPEERAIILMGLGYTMGDISKVLKDSHGRPAKSSNKKSSRSFSAPPPSSRPSSRSQQPKISAKSLVKSMKSERREGKKRSFLQKTSHLFGARDRAACSLV